MSSRTLISGQAGVAVFLQDGCVQSFHLDGPAGVERRKEEIPQLFGDCKDTVAVEGIQREAVSARLELEWGKQRCLTLCLLLLNIESDSEARQLAASDIEEFLIIPEIASFVQARLFVAPIPDSADLLGAINFAHNHGAHTLVGILEEVGVYQAEIARCRSAWDSVPVQSFREESSKEAVAFDLVQAGAFYQLATTAPAKRGGLLMNLLLRPEFKRWHEKPLHKSGSGRGTRERKGSKEPPSC
jgi:hypothetical protein